MKKILFISYLILLSAIISSRPDLPNNTQTSSPGAQEIVKHAELMQELKTFEKQKIKTIKAQPQMPKAPHQYTQTEADIRLMFDNYGPISSRDLNWYIDDFLGWAEVQEKDRGTYRPILLQIYENEKQFPQYYVFYHAYKKELGLLFDVYKELFDLLNIAAGSEHTVVIRDIMKPRGLKYTNVNEFLDFWPTTQFYKDQVIARSKRPYDQWLGGWNDSKDPLRALILSANISLFGNAYDNHANSVYYFVHSQSFTKTSNLLQSFFKIWKFDEKYMQQLYDVQQLVTAGQSGHMLQIFIPKEQVNNQVYISGIFGLPWPNKITSTFDEQKKRHADALSILELYRNNPSAIVTEFGKEDYEEYEKTPADKRYSPTFLNTASKFSVDILQARILLTPQLFDPANDIKMFRYSLTPEKESAEYRKKLKAIVRNMLSDWMNEPTNQEYFKKLNVPLTKLTEFIKAGQSIKR